MDNVGIVVDDLKAAIAFFQELGLELEGEATVEGPSVDSTVGLEGVRSDIAMLRTPDGHSRLELSKFHTPPATSSEPNRPVNRLGIGRIMFAVDNIEDVLQRLQSRGAELIGIPATSHWTVAAIIVPGYQRTKSCIVTRRRTSRRPMPSSLAA